MDQTKVLEYLNNSVSANYFESLTSAQVKKLVLFSCFPIVGAPNVSDPHYFALIENISCLIKFKPADRN